jgi:plastocyanin
MLVSTDTHPGQSLISGQVKLVAASGQMLTPGESMDTLVYFVPESGVGRVHPATYTVYTVNRDFKPSAMAVPIGSTIKFVNLDQIRHNVFSVTPGSAFNLGDQAVGMTTTHTYTRAGLVLIGCNVHRSMELDLLVVPTPYRTAVAADGTFVLRGVPTGPGTLYFWNPRAKLLEQATSAPQEGIKQKVVVEKPRVTTELNVSIAP